MKDEVNPMVGLGATTELCRLLGDPSRVRLLSLLAHEQLTVAELTQITSLTQSRVSSHLKKLKEAQIVRDRRSGSCCFYMTNNGGMPAEAQHLWALLRENTQDPILEEDLERMSEILRRRDAGRSWADSVAGRMDRHYSPGRTWEATARGAFGLLDLGRVLDIASGDGVIAELLSPRADTVTCVDLSPRVVEAGRQRLRHLDNVQFCQGDMHALPFASASFDEVLLMNALTYSRRPEQVIREAARVLCDRGRMVGATLHRHQHEAAVVPYNHLRLGFVPRELQQLLEGAGFEVELCAVTSTEPRAPHFKLITIHARKSARKA